MLKPFFDVFPTLKVEGDLKTFFEETEVGRVTANRARTRYKVTVHSGHLIHRDHICGMQKKLEEQVFGGCKAPGRERAEVYIEERYTLSSLYTPRRLMEEYFDSLASEISGYSHVMGAFFRDADLSYPQEDEICLQLDDSFISRKLQEQLEEALNRVFRDRCGMHATIRVELKKKHPDRRETSRRGVRNIKPVTGPEADFNIGGPENNSIPVRPENSSIPVRPEENLNPSPSEKSYYPSLPKEREDRDTGAASGDGGFSGGKGQNGDPAQRSAGNGQAAGGKKRGKKDIRSAKSTDPDVLYGRTVADEAVPISEVIGDIGEVTVRGEITGNDHREISGGRTIVKFFMTDHTDSIGCKLFVPREDAEEILNSLSKGVWVKVKGTAAMDTFDREVVIKSVYGIQKIPPFIEKRKDTCTRRRVELHCHTKMSDMDGVSECKDLVERAFKWGMPAIAITDHGNVQAFPDANHVREKLLSSEDRRRSEEGLPPVDPQDFFKVIYGIECYLVDDLKKCVEIGPNEKESDTAYDRRYVVFDLETTGFSPEKDRIIEIGAVLIENGAIIDRFSSFVNPGIPIPYRIQQLTGINDSMVIGADPVEEVLPRFLSFSEGSVLVGHNVNFDFGFVRENAKRLGLEVPFTTVDTLGLSRLLLPGHTRYTLDAVAKLLNVPLGSHHRAVDDAECTAGILLKEMELLKKTGADTFGRINSAADSNPEIIKRLRTHHCILLAKNNTGRVNLYKLVSDSHLRWFYKKPRIPKSELIKHREGLLVGSACVAGELFEALLEERSGETLASIASFYDYLEIQPRDNNRFLLDSPRMQNKYPQIRTEEDLLELNRKVVRLGESLGKPVVATCDVHFMDPEDKIYRSIIQDGMGMDAEEPAPLYLRTTDEMLQEFSYLGAAKAEEVVIDNTVKIASMIDAISPVRPDKCPPVIPDSDSTLREICYSKAHSMYGDPLPEIVEERLERELGSIISNGYSVMYIIAQKLVWKSIEDGYLVGSRGSVGSSFVATMSGITEVNPLPPHYYCPSCHYSDFDSEEVRAYAGKCGIDLPRKMCPRCGSELKKDGFDIPFETFLGFKGDKEPDIDLNFSGEYQAKAHAYTKVIFGHEQTFKAGTIATVADKTAYGYVKKYFEKKQIEKRGCEIERLLAGCTGIRRSTGQHPGGIVVLPLGEDINTFTPVQHPANDMTTDIITTHFDYHSIDHNLLKLDILGHDDPTMIRMLQDLTGLDPVEIPLDDPDVMSLFSSTKALGITPQDNGGIDVGSLGIPEFGTKFVIGMLDDTRPGTMSELVRISGLSHGTDVWLGNAQSLIQEGKADLSHCICTRDDIMSYLIGMGMDKSLSFKTMESVRKGKGLKPEMIDAMTAAGVPDWYIDSCQKIKYMFPRAHAAAYVMMALRIAYCKVHYPLEYYAAYYSIRSSAFSYEIMCRGQDHLLAVMEDYARRKDELTPKEAATLDDCLVVREMYARGFEFMPIDIYKAGARNCRIIDGKIMPALTSIDGLGEKAADALEEAAAAGPFISRDDLWNRTKVPKTVIDRMHALGILGDLPESNQISLFDLME